MRSPSRARTGMLAEHLGKGAAEVESCLRRIDSLIACIEELRGKRRSLVGAEEEAALRLMTSAKWSRQPPCAMFIEHLPRIRK